MKERPDVAQEVRKWIEKAEHDLLAAEHAMQLADRGLTDIVCFHCQQCAEKYIKGLLLLINIRYPKTHDLRLLMDLMPPSIALELSREKVVWLNRYTIEARYPGDWEPITKAEAKSALKTARAVRVAVRKHMPRSVFKGL